MSKRKIYVFTDQYPWGKGEKPFIEPELKVLSKSFDITIISMASDEAYDDVQSKSELPKGVKAVHWKWPPLFIFGFHALGYPFSRIARQDLRRVFNEGFTFGRVLDSIKAYGISHALLSFYRRLEIFEDPDAVFYSFWFSYQLLALAFAKLKHSDLKLLSRIHGYDLYNERNAHGRQPFQWFKRLQVDRLLFLSSAAEVYFAKNFGEPAHEGHYLQLGLGVYDQGEQPHPREEDPAAFRLVSCSNLIPLKRVQLIAEALGLLQDPSIEWVHFGDGASRDPVKRTCDKLGVAIDLRGHVENREVIDFYRSTYVDAFITTSSTEGVPISIEEAMSFGIPIIATNVGGIADQVDGNGVLLSEDPAPEEIAAAIQYMKTSRDEEIDKMRKRSKALWEGRFDAARLKDELLSVMDESCRSSQREHECLNEQYDA